MSCRSENDDYRTEISWWILAIVECWAFFIALFTISYKAIRGHDDDDSTEAVVKSAKSIHNGQRSIILSCHPVVLYGNFSNNSRLLWIGGIKSAIHELKKRNRSFI